MPPRGVWLPAAFFALGGVLEVALSLHELPRPLAFWPVWEAVGRGALHALLAWGLWHRKAFCRTVAMVYSLAMIVMHPIVIGLALFRAPFHFPVSVVVRSLYELPSCAVLFPFLRSARAAALYPRSLL
ncbi:MAG TPA: hypothetical protein VII13_10495 [Vicinamibacteria bacterium]|jgi:hypothetical protein